MDVAGVADFSRIAAREGAVLLKNNNSALPVRDEGVSVFGRTQINYYKSGTGSGGAVNVRRIVNILEGLRENPHVDVNEDLAQKYERWVKEYPADYNNTFEADFSDKEIPLKKEEVKLAAQKTKKAIVVIGRVAGESYDNKDEAGSFRLAPKEEKMLELVCKYFQQVIVLVNSGNIFDMTWADHYNVAALMLIWQGGQYGGKAVADLISGDVSPSGKLCDTIAYQYADYPSSKNFGDKETNDYCEDIYVGYRYFETFAKDRVLYPFGFGLSYTQFDTKTVDAKEDAGKIALCVKVKNTGLVPAKEVVQVYYSAPQGGLGKPARELAAFKKTRVLAAGAQQELTIAFGINEMASYDDSGITGNRFCYVLEPGTYDIYVGTNVRNAEKVFSYTVDQTTVTEKLSQACAPLVSFQRMINKDGHPAYEEAPKSETDVVQTIKANLPGNMKITGNRGYRLPDVAKGRISVNQFITQLDEDELMAITRGEGMLSPKVTAGTASCFGGVTDALQKYGIPACSTADGPSGIRMDNNEKATNIPNGTLLACMWNPELAQALFEMESRELMQNRIDVQLGPGMNIHRDPLCGRNFEYFSEDPLVTGITAAAVVKGIQFRGNGAAIKHFALNNQEYERSRVMAVVSERAAREIYLKGFEIVVKTAAPKTVMTSYNPFNGYWNASNYELTTSILRTEWGFEGFVMTDWWAQMNNAPQDSCSAKKRAAMVKAGNNVYMVVDNNTAGNHEQDDLKEALKDGTLNVGELQKNAAQICRVIMGLPAFTGKRDASPPDMKNLNMPLLKGLRINGKSLDEFDPYQLDYYIKEVKSVQAESDHFCELRTYGHITECIVHDGSNETIYKVVAGRDMDEVAAKSFVDMGKVFVTNNTSIMCELGGKPGDEVEYQLDVREAHRYRLSVYASSDASELAQLSVFIDVAGQKKAIAMRGTNGTPERSEYVYIDLDVGETKMKVIFGANNMADVNVSLIQIEFA